MSKPAKQGYPGAITRWDDLQYAHIQLTNVVHDVVSSTRHGLIPRSNHFTGSFPAMAPLLCVCPRQATQGGVWLQGRLPVSHEKELSLAVNYAHTEFDH